MRIKTGINEIRTHCAHGAAIPQRSLPFSFANTESRAVSSIDFGSASVKPRSGQKPIGGAPPVGLKAWKTFFYIIAAEAKSVKVAGVSFCFHIVTLYSAEGSGANCGSCEKPYSAFVSKYTTVYLLTKVAALSPRFLMRPGLENAYPTVSATRGLGI